MRFINAVRKLAAELQAGDNVVVSVQRCGLEVVEQLSAAARHGDKAAAGMEVLLVRAEMLGEVGNTRAQDGNLNFAGTRIFVVKAVFLDD